MADNITIRDFFGIIAVLTVVIAIVHINILLAHSIDQFVAEHILTIFDATSFGQNVKNAVVQSRQIGSVEMSDTVAGFLVDVSSGLQSQVTKNLVVVINIIVILIVFRSNHNRRIQIVMILIDVGQQIMPDRTLLPNAPFNDIPYPVLLTKEIHALFVQIVIGLADCQSHRHQQFVGMIDQTQAAIFHGDIAVFDIKHLAHM